MALGQHYKLTVCTREASSSQALGRLLVERCVELLSQVKLSYASVLIRDERSFEAAILGEGLSQDDPLQSATAWALLSRFKRPLLLDLRLGLALDLSVPIKPAPAVIERFDERSSVSMSISRHLSSQATHLLLVPALEGQMLALGLEAPSWLGHHTLDDQVIMALELMAATLAARALELARHLGASAHPHALEDELMPVIGQRMAPLMELLQRFAKAQETILITGPTGAGKSRLARWVHARSSCASGPFEVLNLLSVPAQMQMAELFGWRKGAFTDATKDHLGALERAQGGTLFIDELDKLSLAAQAGLLQLLEEGTYRPLGHTGAPKEAKVRFIVGSNADLSQACASGQLLEDLYWRINVLPIALPGLDQRQDELERWLALMLARANAPELTLDDEARARLKAQRWPGNLRQLDHLARRLVHICAATHQRQVGVAQLEQALGLDAQRAGGLERDLERVAGQLAHALLGRWPQAHDDPSMLEAIAGLEALVVEAASLSLEGDQAQALSRLGRAALVKSRNHHKLLRAHADRAAHLRALLRALDQESAKA